MMSMKRARLEDIPQIVAMAQEMHAEGNYKDVVFEPEMFTGFLSIILSEDNNACFIWVEDNKMVGGIIGSVGPHPFSQTLRAVDLGFYVRPSHRGSPVAVRLLRMYEEWARGKGAERIYLGSSNGHYKTHAFFEKMGYNMTGGLYQKQEQQNVST